MQRIHIFKPGKHTSAGGTSLEFNESDLQAAVSAYDPSIHEAPIVVGHPKDNGPAYGWVGSLEYDDKGVHAIPRQINSDFQEQVQAGSYKKVSASFYLPDAPGNPAPGNLYLRHVGFLGAAPPAIKGLEPVQFSEDEQGVVEFNEIANTVMGETLSRLREWIIDKFSRDEADNVIPKGAIWDLELASKIEQQERLEQEQGSENPEPAFSEGTTDHPNEEDDMPTMQEELEAARTRIQELENQVNGGAGNNPGNSDFTERERQLAERERAIQKQELQSKIKQVADQGRIMPADVEPLAEFAAHLEADEQQAVQFSEQEQAKAPREFFLAWLAKQPKRVDFTEHSADGDEPPQDETPSAVADRIIAYREAKSEQGVSVSCQQALNAVKEGRDQAK